ncbi:MAG: protein-L-isoaspartate O-methyltransferase, partial [Elusimicrobia bacterium]|nr:protein-L-isoaspartate O-methyltransferase [Elusimicrobiota bacterium]
AILSEVGAETYSIEIVPELAQFARKNLDRAGYPQVIVKSGDGYEGWPEHAPFDAIIVTCAPEKVPQPLASQLKEGGRMVIPVGPENDVQELYLLTKVNGQLFQKSVAPVRFVPMSGQSQKK